MVLTVALIVVLIVVLIVLLTVALTVALTVVLTVVLTEVLTEVLSLIATGYGTRVDARDHIEMCIQLPRGATCHDHGARVMGLSQGSG